ncbi:MAG: N-acetylmuramoyl-L-alanine amidase [Gammaproteobacteria bacterium]|nr:N-acetylmuramoyl-L-alanine amidase [Gammaproteobacteria bacterium]
MRQIKQIAIHCSATIEGIDFKASDIRRWHKQRGWSDIGYHFVIRLNGDVETGRPIERAGAHVKGYNSKSIGICLIGGLDKDKQPKATFTDNQLIALKGLLAGLSALYPNADILGHRDFPNVHKDCPCFDVQHWLATGEVTE